MELDLGWICGRGAAKNMRQRPVTVLERANAKTKKKEEI